MSQMLSKDIRQLIESKSIDINISENKENIFKTIEALTTLLLETPIERVEEEVLSFLVPGVKVLLIEAYKYNECSRNNCNKSLIEENIQFALALTSVIENIIEFAASNSENEQVFYLKNVLSIIPECLCISFKHCKESQNFYHTTLDDCSDVLFLYKNTQEIYLKYLKFINSINMMEHEVEVLNSVNVILNCLEIVFGMNVKCLVDTWKIYCNFLEKYKCLNENLHLTKVLDVLIYQIHFLLKSDNKNVAIQNVKLAGFLMKIGLIVAKVCMKSNLEVHTYNFFSKFFKIYWSLENNIEVKMQSQVCLINLLVNFVKDHLLMEEYLNQMYSLDYQTKNTCNCFYFDIFLGKCCLQLKDEITIQSFPFVPYVKHIFDHILQDTSLSCQDITLIFQDIVLIWHTLILECPDFYCKDLETIFFDNLICCNIWCVLLVHEIWIKILRSISDESLENFILGFTEQVLQIDFGQLLFAPQWIFAKKFLEKLIDSLPNNKIADLLQIYNPMDKNNNKIWKSLEILNVPLECLPLVRNLGCTLLKEIDNVENYQSIDQFMNLIDTIKINSHLMCQPDNELLSAIIKLWQLNYEQCNFSKYFFKYFINALFELTHRCILFWRNNELLVLLKQLKHLCRNSKSCKLSCSLLLDSLSTKKFDFDEHLAGVQSTTSDIFEILLTEKNRSIAETAAWTFEHIRRHDKQPVIINNVCRMLPNVQKILDELNKVNSNGMPNILHTCPVVETIRFPAKNTPAEDLVPEIRVKIKPNEAIENVNKKIKLGVEENDDIDDVLQRIKGEIKCLEKITRKEKLSLKNGIFIKQLISQLQLCLEIKG